MDFISWTETIKVIFLVIVLGFMVALIFAAISATLFVSLITWHGMRAKKKTSEELLNEAVTKLDEHEQKSNNADEE